MQSTLKATKKHCAFCFQTLLCNLNKTTAPTYPPTLPTGKVPIFVTWKKNNDLRGCIGTFEPGYLSTILPRYALIAALKDSRFPPIQKQQIQKLSVAVSFLVNFQEGKKVYDWEVGKHGIIIDIEDVYNATFLPEVAKEQGWDQKQTMRALVRKAGWSGTLEEAEKVIKLTTYESSKEYMSYEEFVKGDWKN